MIRRLLGAVVDGFGHTAGSTLFHEVATELDKSLPPEETDEQRAKREQREAAARAKESERLAREAKKAREKRDREIEEELVALKKKVVR